MDLISILEELRKYFWRSGLILILKKQQQQQQQQQQQKQTKQNKNKKQTKTKQNKTKQNISVSIPKVTIKPIVSYSSILFKCMEWNIIIYGILRQILVHSNCCFMFFNSISVKNCLIKVQIQKSFCT